MKIKDLISKLKKYPEDTEVMVWPSKHEEIPCDPDFEMTNFREVVERSGLKYLSVHSKRTCVAPNSGHRCGDECWEKNKIPVLMLEMGL